MATRANIETQLTAFFGSAQSWKVSDTPNGKRGVVSGFETIAEFYDGTGIKVTGDTFEQPRPFTLARHIPSGQWYISAGWNA